MRTMGHSSGTNAFLGWPAARLHGPRGARHCRRSQALSNWSKCCRRSVKAQSIRLSRLRMLDLSTPVAVGVSVRRVPRRTLTVGRQDLPNVYDE